MTRTYKRDVRGRFAKAVQGRRLNKAAKLSAKNDRVRAQYKKDKSLHGTPLGYQIERRIARRDQKIARLRR